jgi:hypothetical protein
MTDVEQAETEQYIAKVGIIKFLGDKIYAQGEFCLAPSGDLYFKVHDNPKDQGTWDPQAGRYIVHEVMLLCEEYQITRLWTPTLSKSVTKWIEALISADVAVIPI